MKELVGKGKPFHSALDMGAQALKRKVGTGAEFMQELMGLTGIKKAEIEERGLGELMGMPKMTHEQFMQELSKKPAPAIGEKIFAGSNSKYHKEAADDSYHEQYTLPGGENYREMLIKLPKFNQESKLMEVEARLRRAAPAEIPRLERIRNDLVAEKERTPEVFQGVHHHFGGEPGILASMRLKDRTGPNGEKLLHLEELQSDWHQQGREKGYAQPETSRMTGKVVDAGDGTYKVEWPDGTFSGGYNWASAMEKAEQGKSNAKLGVPDAPFKKNWEEMALKRLIHHAAEKGYHGIVVTPGAEQADRYNLAKHINRLSYGKTDNDDHYEITALDKEGHPALVKKIPRDELHDTLGKELAEKILAGEGQEYPKGSVSHGKKYFEGLDLQVGGEGMKGFYDKKVPNILNAIGKKHGVKTQLAGYKLLGDPSQRGHASERLGLAHLSLAGMTDEQVQAFNQKLDDLNTKYLHHFPITEEMRKDVLKNGLPLYKEGGSTNTEGMHMSKGGSKKKPTVAEMKQAIFEKNQAGLMKPSEVLGKHEGKHLHLTEADRAKVEKTKHGLRGGVGFSQIGLENPEYAGRVWGVGKSGTAIKLLNREKRGLKPDDKSIWSTFIGSPEMHTSNQLVFNRMWNKFQEARKAGLLSPELEEKMLDFMRTAMTKGTEKNPSKPVFEHDVDFDNTHHLFDTFERRRILADLMAGNKIGGKKGQIFDATKVIEGTTDPRLLHAPTFSVGPHLFSFSGETSYEPELNKAFPFMLHGETSPEAFKQIPLEIAAKDFREQILREKGREPGYMDIVRNIPRQHLTEAYLTHLQKHGYADGGPVDISEVGVNEAPNLPVKAYTLPSGQSGQLPVGGVDLDPQQQGQQLMSPQPQQPPMTPQPQQGMPNMGTASAPQSLSNILQMTKQGQAMSAMRPSQPMPAKPSGMKRGGKVTMPSNDAMRFALMARKKVK